MDDQPRPQPRVTTTNLGSAISSASYSATGGTPSWQSGPSPSPTPHNGGHTPSTPLPPPKNVVPRSLTERESQLVKHLSRLQFFLATAPTRWMGTDDSPAHTASAYQPGPLSSPHPNLNRFLLPNGEYVACVFWNGLYHITGTDIVRALVFRFEAFSRPVHNIKKFEEGVFSDLRNLKPGTDACLEEPKSPFLDLLFRNGCIRTQKKQKVFYWFSVPHDRLFLDALERDLKREKIGLEPTTLVVGEPARSFRYDPKRSLFEQFAGKQPEIEDSFKTGVDEEASCRAPPAVDTGGLHGDAHDVNQDGDVMTISPNRTARESSVPLDGSPSATTPHSDHAVQGVADRPPPAVNVLFSRSLFEGSPAYKQRRKKSSTEKKSRSLRGGTATTSYDTGDEESGSDSDGAHQADFSFISRSNQMPLGAGSFAPLIQPVSFDGQNSPAPEPPHADMLRASHQPTAMTNNIPSGLDLESAHHLPLPPPMPWQASRRSSPSVQHDPAATAQTLGSYGIPNRSSTTPQPGIPATQAGSVVASTGGATKGFSCPLLSCGRLFKRLEHLKRHVRTHTQERPYECTRCAKRFSRSDNLTQHIKTHEKADRGERLKTEASEILEDDMATFLEAEVDAMAAREGRPFSTDTDAPTLPARQYRYGLGDAHLSADPSNKSPARQPLQAGGYHALPTVTTTPCLSQAAIEYQRNAAGGSDWPPFLPYPSTATNHLQGNNASLNKRHRSMTPNPPLTARSYLLNGPIQSAAFVHQPRFHPYATSTAAGGVPSADYRSQTYQRACSLDPTAFQTRSIPFESNNAGNSTARDTLNFNLLANAADPAFNLRGSEDPMSRTYDSDISRSSASSQHLRRGLKDGADGDQVASDRMNDWGEGS